MPLPVLASMWAIAVAVPVLAFARTSGGHLNPGVTISLALGERFPSYEVAPYVGAQFAGAGVGSLAVLVLLGNRAELGATVPAPGNLWVPFLGEVLFTFLLLASVFYLVTRPRAPTLPELLLPALVVGVSTYVIGPLSGSSLNLARTVAPALLSGAYTDLWLYLIAVPAGGTLTAVIYRAGFARARTGPRRGRPIGPSRPGTEPYEVNT
jgi:aquaporin Z